MKLPRFLIIRKRVSKIPVFIRRKPLSAFLISLGLLFLLMVLGNTLFKTKVSPPPQVESIKEVNLFTIGQTPHFKASAQVQKEGVIVVMAQTPAVVSQIKISQGDTVKGGQTLISLSSNYQGGNAPSLTRQLAAKQYQNIKDTFDTQKDIIGKQRQLANENANNTEELRKISVQSNDDTKALLSLNQDILSVLATDLDNQIKNNAAPSTIQAARIAKAPYQAAVNQLQAQVRAADYSTNTNNPPTNITNLDKDIVLKQLDLQEKALILSKEVSQIQLNLAAVNEAIMFPAAPCPGTVQKIHVHIGQLVNPGAPLVTIYAPAGQVTVEAKVPAQVAHSISLIELSSLKIGNETITAIPDFVSSQATDGQLYSVFYQIPDLIKEKLTDKEFIAIDIPISQSSSSAAVIFVPLDSVYQTTSESFVYVKEEGKATSKKVSLGTVLGSDVEILDGLKDGDQVILNRNVVAGDKVK